MSRDFLRWEAFHNDGAMPLRSNMWGGAVGRYHIPIPRPTYADGQPMTSSMRDQLEFFNGAPMTFPMRDRWSQGFGTYGNRERLNPMAPEFFPRFRDYWEKRFNTVRWREYIVGLSFCVNVIAVLYHSRGDNNAPERTPTYYLDPAKQPTKGIQGTVSGPIFATSCSSPNSLPDFCQKSPTAKQAPDSIHPTEQFFPNSPLFQYLS